MTDVDTMSYVDSDVHPHHPIPDNVTRGIEKYREARTRRGQASGLPVGLYGAFPDH